MFHRRIVRDITPEEMFITRDMEEEEEEENLRQKLIILNQRGLTSLTCRLSRTTREARRGASADWAPSLNISQ